MQFTHARKSRSSVTSVGSTVKRTKNHKSFTEAELWRFRGFFRISDSRAQIVTSTSVLNLAYYIKSDSKRWIFSEPSTEYESRTLPYVCDVQSSSPGCDIHLK